jgi:hypothetical protein
MPHMYEPKDYITLPDIPEGLRGDVERVALYLYRANYPDGPGWAQLDEGAKDGWRHLARHVIDGK